MSNIIIHPDQQPFEWRLITGYVINDAFDPIIPEVIYEPTNRPTLIIIDDPEDPPKEKIYGVWQKDKNKILQRILEDIWERGTPLQEIILRNAEEVDYEDVTYNRLNT